MGCAIASPKYLLKRFCYVLIKNRSKVQNDIRRTKNVPMSRICSTLFAALIILSFIFTTATAHTQYRASIQKIVTDQQKTVVPNATCTLRNIETGQTLTAVT